MSVYFEAANILKLVKEKRGSIKNLVFSSDCQNKKSLYAVVCESLKYHEVLSELLERTALVKVEKSLKKNVDLGIVLLYEHLFGKGLTGRFQHIIKKHKSSIHSQSELMKVRAGVTCLKQLLKGNSEEPAVSLPKYVRVNTIKSKTETVIQKFKHEGWSHVDCTKDSFRSVVSSLDKDKFTTDPHIPDLLVFPPTTDFHTNKMYMSGDIILQDKASCFPAYLLAPPPGSQVIDCCAAPGNKTSHLAAEINNHGKVFAFDKDHKRLSTLENMMEKVGATCVEARCQDFLSVNPNNSKYSGVEYILVDPSCSGTGMVNRRTQQLNEEEVSNDRLEKLSKFQITILKHAFKFPNVRRIVYSTCSTHEKENEAVVEEVMLAMNQEFRMRLIMPDWPERGVKGYEHAYSCLRMSHDSALTNGFFVACFEKKDNIAREYDTLEQSERSSEIEMDFKISKFDNNLSDMQVCEVNADKSKLKGKKLKHKNKNVIHTQETNIDSEGNSSHRKKTI